MPQNWKTYKLSELTSVITKGTTPSTYGFDFEESGINYIRAQSLSYDGTIDESAFSFVSAEAHEKLKRSQLQVNDILFSMAGAYLGMTGMVKESYCPANTNQAVGIIRINHPEVLPKFVEYALRNPNTVEYVNSQSGQSAQPNINLTEIGNLSFPFPPLPEQRAIASILSSLDDKIELNLQMNKTLEEMAMTLYKHWFVDFGPFTPPCKGGAWKAGDLRAKDENTPCFGSGKFIDSELGLIPEGWEMKRLGDVIETLGGGTPKTTVDEYWENGTIDWYSPTDLTKANTLYSLGTAKKITELGLKKSSSKLFPKGSLLMSSRATIGAITINRKEACTNQGFITMIPNEKVSLYQLHGWTVTNMDLIISKANGSTFKEISKSNFRDLLITVGVELDEYLRSVESIYSQIENNILENQTLTNLRDILLPKLISGAVRVKDVESQVAEVL